MGSAWSRKSAAIVVGIGMALIGASGVFAGAWVNATSNLANMASECGNLCLVTAVPGKNLVVAGIAQKGLWGSTDGGSSWAQLGGAVGATITNRTGQIIFDPLNANIWWECGIYNGVGVFKTTDCGVSFTALGLHHNDGLGVDFSDPQRKVIIVGGHEQKQTVNKSTDGGATWTSIGTSFPSDAAFSSQPLVVDANTYLMGCGGWGGGNAGIYRTTDGGATWNRIFDTAPAGAPLMTSWGTYYWGNSSAGSVLKSTDKGATWNAITVAGAGAYRPIEIPGNGVATIGTGGIVVSRNDGTSWTRVTPAIPITSGLAGIAYNSVDTSFYVWKWDCGNIVLPDGIWKYDSTGFYVYGLTASPIRAYNNVATKIIFTVNTGNAHAAISGVTIDLSSLGGGTSVAMTKGTADLYADTFTVAAGAVPGVKTVMATSTSAGVSKSMSTTVSILDASAPLKYKGVYTDTANITSVNWVGDGAGNKSTFTEVSSGAFEGTKCYNFNWTVGGYWAGAGLIPTGNQLDASAYDYFHVAYKGPGTGFTASLQFTHSDNTASTAYVLTNSPTWKSVDIPLTYFTDKGFAVNSIYLMNFMIGGGAATGSGDLLLDNMLLISGYLATSVMPSTKAATEKPIFSAVALHQGKLEIASPVDGIAAIYTPNGAVLESMSVKAGVARLSSKVPLEGVYLVKFTGAGVAQTRAVLVR